MRRLPLWQKLGLAVFGLALVAVLLGLVYGRAPGFVNEHSLGYSAARKAGGLTVLGFDDSPICRERDTPESTWNCKIDDPGGSSTTTYEVTTDGNCWKGTLTGAKIGDGITWSERIEGCVRIGDNLRLGRRFLDLIGFVTLNGSSGQVPWLSR